MNNRTAITMLSTLFTDALAEQLTDEQLTIWGNILILIGTDMVTLASLSVIDKVNSANAGQSNLPPEAH